MANLPTTMEYFDNLLGEQLTEEGGGGSSDFIICVDSVSLPLDVYLNEIAEQDPDVKLSAGTAQIFTDPVYCVDMPALRMTAYYGELINMGHILGDPNNPEYFKIEGDLFINVARK